jgi:beta-galactosidase
VHLVPGTNTVFARADIGGTALSDTLQWTYSGNPTVVRIKAGDVSSFIARDGNRYGSDIYFDGGDGKGINPPDTAETNRVTVAAADATLYDSYREGEFTYHIPVPDGRYRIVAKFAEPSADGPGQRLFDVIVNGKTALRGLDVFAAAGGRLKGVDQIFDAVAVSGKIDIRFRPVKGSAIVSALAVTPIPSGEN